MAISFRSSATSTAETITGPADIVSGDLLVLLDGSYLETGGGATAVPTDFNILSNVSQGSRRQIISYKIADGSEASATLTGMAGTTLVKALAVFDASAASVTPSTFNEEGTAGNPTAQNVAASGGPPPLIVLGLYGARGSPGIVDPITFSTTEDGTVAIQPGGNDQGIVLAYKIYNTSPADNTSIDMADEGIDNILQSGYLYVPQLSADNFVASMMEGDESIIANWRKVEVVGY